MLIDPYSPCPGGTGNKIKFCCPHLLGELQKIVRMLEGEQYQACLRYVERLEKSHPDKACLLSVKPLLFRVLGNLDQAQAAAAAFLEKHPHNPIALAESAVAAAIRHDSRKAMELILSALTASGGEMRSRVYQAMDALVPMLLVEGQIVAARAVAMIQFDLVREDRRPVAFLMRLNSSPGIPLVIKEDRPLPCSPRDAPWKAEYDQAVSLLGEARWVQAAERLAALAERVGDEPIIWESLATLRGWLADTPGCIQALRKLATLDVPLEDAVEAEAMALFLCDDPLGDHLEVSTLRYTVRDAQRVEQGLASSPKAIQMRVDPASFAEEDSPPPKAVFFLFDQAMPEAGTEITAETASQTVGRALLYGKQTDREARLEVSDVSASNLDQVKALIAEAAGDALDGEPQHEVTGHVSASRQLFSSNWRLPADLSRKDLQRMVIQHIERALLQKWPQLPLGLLDGNCPQEAADQQAYRVKLLAAIMVLEFWLEQADSRFDFNRLRTRLGLPTLEPIDPHTTPLEQLPLVRLSRVMVERLSDEALVRGYRRAMGYGARAATENFAQAVVERSSLAGRREQFLAFEMLASMAEDSDQALKYVDEARNLSLQAGRSCAHWDLIELPLRMERGEPDEMSRLLDHLQSQHINEPGVARALTELLVEAGILNPDGTPTTAPQAAAEEPSLVVPGQSGAKPGELWTPGGQKPTGEKPKIWRPGMD